MHEPIAIREAQFAECMGQVNGRSAFWEAIDWIYQHTRGDGLGIPDSTPYPDLSPSIQTCLDNGRTNAVIQTRAREGSQAGISATPTLMIRENQNGQELILPGPVEGDALLSALDLLTAQNANESDAETEIPNELVGEIPR
ncbi:DsbA family protein [Pseudomonas sp. XS1P51]